MRIKRIQASPQGHRERYLTFCQCSIFSIGTLRLNKPCRCSEKYFEANPSILNFSILLFKSVGRARGLDIVEAKKKHKTLITIPLLFFLQPIYPSEAESSLPGSELRLFKLSLLCTFLANGFILAAASLSKE